MGDFLRQLKTGRIFWLRCAGLFLLATSIIGLLGGQLHARSLPPRDECSADASFQAFRTELLKAIARKDSRYLLSIVSPSIQNGYGSDSGRPDFVVQWGLDQPASSPIWVKLKTILSLGCTSGSDEVHIPYFPGDPDPLETVVVIKQGSLLRAAPQQTAPVKVKLHLWEVLTQPNWVAGAWLSVRTSSGESGYVEDRFVYSLIASRALFRKDTGRWMLTALVGGD
jgi:hypothetical protein